MVSALLVTIVYVSSLVSPQAHAWVLENLPRLFAAAGISVIFAVPWIQRRKLERYRAGDDPLRVARIFMAFGSRKSAIRYLEDALRYDPTSEAIERKLQDLRSKQ